MPDISLSTELEYHLLLSMLADYRRQGIIFECSFTGKSMIPLLLPGDKLTINPHPKNELRVGDLVLFTHHQQLFTHRIMAIDERGVLFQMGDNGSRMEGLEMPDVYGLITAFTRNGKKFNLRDEWARRYANIVVQIQLNYLKVTPYLPTHHLIQACTRRVRTFILYTALQTLLFHSQFRNRRR